MEKATGEDVMEQVEEKKKLWELVEEVKAKGPVLLAMKGFPCTGKSTLARKISKALGCPLIDYDDVRACTVCIHEVSSISTYETNELLDKLSYEAISRIASRQLSLFDRVVIDSPLACEYHFNCLKQLASSSSVSLFVIECKPRDESKWRQRVEKRIREVDDGTRWYKPSTWEDLQFLLRNYYDGNENEVPKLVIDTILDDKIIDHLEEAMKFIVSEGKPGQKEKKGNREGSKTLGGDHAHPLTFCDELREDDKSSRCSHCKEFILAPSYNCTNCAYILHNSCADTPLTIQLPVHDQPLTLFRPPPSGPYLLGRCNICEEYGFRLGYPLYECKSSKNLAIHPKCALLPTNLKHEWHVHKLKLFLQSALLPQCNICANTCHLANYGCPECGFYLHVWCAFLPLTAKHDRHLHTLSLAMAPLDDTDEYYCNACEEPREPNPHVYYCEECEFAAHLHCLVPSELSGPPPEIDPEGYWIPSLPYNPVKKWGQMEMDAFMRGEKMLAEIKIE